MVCVCVTDHKHLTSFIKKEKWQKFQNSIPFYKTGEWKKIRFFLYQHVPIIPYNRTYIYINFCYLYLFLSAAFNLNMFIYIKRQKYPKECQKIYRFTCLAFKISFFTPYTHVDYIYFNMALITVTCLSQQYFFFLF